MHERNGKIRVWIQTSGMAGVSGLSLMGGRRDQGGDKMDPTCTAEAEVQWEHGERI